MWLSLFGSIAAPWRNRFGNVSANLTAFHVHDVPSNDPTTAPRWKTADVLFEHGPHHVASALFPE